MAVSRQVDLLEPINLAEHLDKVELYLGQVCQIAGIYENTLPPEEAARRLGG